MITINLDFPLVKQLTHAFQCQQMLNDGSRQFEQQENQRIRKKLL